MPTDPRQALVAPDSFKGTFTALQVAAAIGRGLERGGLVPPDLCPIADGGEGTSTVLLTALGGETAGITATDPLGRPVKAGYVLLEDGGTAVVEVAEASGLNLVAPEERDPVAATTRGTGELIAAAAAAGAQVVLVCVGGSATTDGGAGAIEAIEEAGGIGAARIVCLCDVTTPFERAPAEFAPQKGADADAIAVLEERQRELARSLPRDPTGVPMTGAAGGLSGGLWAKYGAKLEPGAQFVLDAVGFGDRLRAARAVVTGEGRLDQTTLRGKVAAEVATQARQAGVPCYAVVGQAALDAFGRRMLDLQLVLEATNLEEMETAGERLAAEMTARP
jgi:glycerate 2-kinase